MMKLLPSHLGFWLKNPSWVTARVAAAFDVFRLWSVGLLARSCGVMTGWPLPKAGLWAIFLYVLYVAVLELGLPGIFRGAS